MKWFFNLLFISITLLTISCSDNGTVATPTISDALLTGTVFGEDFSALGGKAFDVGEYVSINITNEDVSCDSNILNYDIYISSVFILQQGTYQGINIVFHKNGELPLHYLQGTTLQVVEFDDTSITVKIKVETNAENSIEGTYTVDYCK